MVLVHFETPPFHFSWRAAVTHHVLGLDTSECINLRYERDERELMVKWE